jgi:DNA polymerase III epsilon subunit-like protein
MRVLIFDTETTGLASSKIISPDTLKLWPHIVQFSYVVYDTEKNDILDLHNSIIRVSEGINIPEESIKFHGITNEISKECGIEIELVLTEFFYQLKSADKIIGHNVSFDINMVKVELLRIIYSKTQSREFKTYFHILTNYKNIYCTLQDSIELCNIKALDKYGKEYLKFPKLIELHQKLFNSDPNNLHNSLNDILVTLRCYIKMKYDYDLNEKCDKFKKIALDIKLF